MVSRGAGKNEATVAESRLRNGGKRKSQKKIPPLHHSAVFAHQFCFNFINLILVLIFIIYLLCSRFYLIPWTDTTVI